MSAPKKNFSAFLKPMPSDPVELPALEPASEPVPATAGDRIRHVTATGRVRTYSATRSLPGVTLRLSETRWERLKMLSIQERRPIQDILGEAMEAYMTRRGLPW